MKNNTPKLLTREQFVIEVFKRDKYKCIFCDKPSVDAHHIFDRKLWTDGGYYIDNGASVCEEHHWAVEKTDISIEEIRAKANIGIILPPNFNLQLVYDKWGNIINTDGTITPGILFNDSGVQKVLKHKLYLFNPL